MNNPQYPLLENIKLEMDQDDEEAQVIDHANRLTPPPSLSPQVTVQKDLSVKERPEYQITVSPLTMQPPNGQAAQPNPFINAPPLNNLFLPNPPDSQINALLASTSPQMVQNLESSLSPNLFALLFPAHQNLAPTPLAPTAQFQSYSPPLWTPTAQMAPPPGLNIGSGLPDAQYPLPIDYGLPAPLSLLSQLPAPPSGLSSSEDLTPPPGLPAPGSMNSLLQFLGPLNLATASLAPPAPNGPSSSLSQLSAPPPGHPISGPSTAPPGLPDFGSLNSLLQFLTPQNLAPLNLTSVSPPPPAPNMPNPGFLLPTHSAAQNGPFNFQPSVGSILAPHRRAGVTARRMTEKVRDLTNQPPELQQMRRHRISDPRTHLLTGLPPWTTENGPNYGAIYQKYKSLQAKIRKVRNEMGTPIVPDSSSQEYQDRLTAAIKRTNTAAIYKDPKLTRRSCLFNPDIQVIPQRVKHPVGSNQYHRSHRKDAKAATEEWRKMREEESAEYWEWKIRAANVLDEHLRQRELGYIWVRPFGKGDCAKKGSKKKKTMGTVAKRGSEVGIGGVEDSDMEMEGTVDEEEDQDDSDVEMNDAEEDDE